jgi:hypothetical protein
MRTTRPALLLATALVLGGAGLAACSDDDDTIVDTFPADDETGSTTSTGGDDPGPAGRDGTDGDTDPGREVSGDGYEGWILDPDADGGTRREGADNVWLTEDDVAAAEAVLAAELPGRLEGADEYEREQLTEVLAELDGYLRQYAGAVEGEAVFVYVNALCTDDVGGEDALRSGFVYVDDGGSCFWSAVVDLGAGTLENLSINGEA